MLIRELDPIRDLAALTTLQTEAQDYWLLADGHCNPAQKATEFFTDCPPNCDPAQTHRLGLFHDGKLSGIAELSFGFPAPNDAYLGLMLLAPHLRGSGAGPILLAEIESRARAAGSPTLYLAVLEANPRGRAFWQRMGFKPAGVTGHDAETGHTLHRLAKPLRP
ncbi:GNAT family N-acetyltransferase [Cypionkella sp.]|uniref:GNAT family N-acetyltransferase n=1 Tax=Cypionkella sp. TaxID=2811411 RepID=UPI002ABB03FB|nr:GNAT family N-acetyltransferase [Cypionkella sp.]MDZ4394676.1 GNAT family N-acetyltransferase [Cypionkella sp.]